jgi:hypothetical protein
MGLSGVGETHILTSDEKLPNLILLKSTPRSSSSIFAWHLFSILWHLFFSGADIQDAQETGQPF